MHSILPDEFHWRWRREDCDHSRRRFTVPFFTRRRAIQFQNLGYQKSDRQSLKAIKFLKWYAYENNVTVRMCNSSPDGEFPLYIPEIQKTFKLDGYIEGDPPTALEFLGCCWHGHHCLYSSRADICPNGKTAEFNYEWTEERCRWIEAQGFVVKQFWECEVEQMLSQNPEMRAFYVTVQDTSPVIRLRDAFLGGRVQPFTLKCDLIDYDQRTGETDAQDFFTIRYYDIVSLYRKLLLPPLPPLNLWHHFLAYVNFTFEYPIGHPEITVFDHDVEWRHPNDHTFKGLLKVEVCMHINNLFLCLFRYLSYLRVRLYISRFFHLKSAKN